MYKVLEAAYKKELDEAKRKGVLSWTEIDDLITLMHDFTIISEFAEGIHHKIVKDVLSSVNYHDAHRKIMEYYDCL